MEDKGSSAPLKRDQQKERAVSQSYTGDLATDPALKQGTEVIPAVHLPGYDDEGSTTVITTAVGTGSKKGLTEQQILRAANMGGLRKYKDISDTSEEDPERPLTPPEWKEGK